jgi:transcriptional regulator with XRE-family HTH domain
MYSKSLPESLRVLVGRRLRAVRRSRKLSQDELFEEYAISTSTLNNWELGRHAPSLMALRTLACAYRVSLDYLLYIADEPNYSYNEERRIECLKQAKIAALLLRSISME